MKYTAHPKDTIYITLEICWLTLLGRPYQYNFGGILNRPARLVSQILQDVARKLVVSQPFRYELNVLAPPNRNDS